MALARIPSSAVLPSYWLGPLTTLQTPVAAGPLNRDDRPVVEYRAPQDLVAIGRTDAGYSPVVIGAMPFADARPSGALFADWAPAEWYLQRARWRVLNEDLPHGAQVARAARAHAPEVAAAVEAEVARGERRSRSALAYGDAIQALRVGDHGKARAALENAVVIDPDNGAAWVLLSEHRRLDNDFAGASAAIEQARRSDDPRVRADAESAVGMLAMARMDFKAAIAAFRVAEGMAPGGTRAYLFEARCHAQLNDMPSALDAVRRGLAAAPNSPELSQALAQLGASR
jgi:predicted Zn-dependent protease